MKLIIAKAEPLPEAYYVRIREYLFHVFEIKVVQDLRKKLVADGICLNVTPNWVADINLATLKDFVHCIMNPFYRE